MPPKHQLRAATLAEGGQSERPAFEIDASAGSAYHRLLTISVYSYCYSVGQSLRDPAVYPQYQWLRREHIWLYERCHAPKHKPIHRDRLIPKRELGYSMQLLKGVLPTREQVAPADRVAAGKRVLSNIMAYRAGYFGCACLAEWDFFASAAQLLAKMAAWERATGQVARVNGWGYGSLANIPPARLRRNVARYFSVDNTLFGPNFATTPPAWSTVRSYIATAKSRKGGSDGGGDRFPIAKGDLISALIASDYARLGWCQLPAACEWPSLLCSGSRKGLNLIVKSQSNSLGTIGRKDLKFAAEDLLQKLKEDLGPEVVQELVVDRIFLEHAMCKVLRLSKNDTRDMLARKL